MIRTTVETRISGSIAPLRSAPILTILCSDARNVCGRTLNGATFIRNARLNSNSVNAFVVSQNEHRTLPCKAPREAGRTFSMSRSLASSLKYRANSAASPNLHPSSASIGNTRATLRLCCKNFSVNK